MNIKDIISKKKLFIHSSSDTVGAVAYLEKFAQIYEIPVVVIQKINVVVKELLCSIVDHTPLKELNTKVELSLVLSSTGKLTIELRYYGVPFNPFFPINKENHTIEDIGSLSLHLARKCMDTYYYRRNNQLNIVSLCKNQV